jgi:hypothetical protein
MNDAREGLQLPPSRRELLSSRGLLAATLALLSGGF